LSIRPTSPVSRLVAIALFALSAGLGVVRAAEEAPKAPDPKRTTSAKAPDAKAATLLAKDKAKKAAATSTDIRKLYEEIAKQRDLLIADFEVLAKQLKDATDEKKKEIKEKMEAQKKAFEEVTNALHRQIREEQRKQRQNAKR
jgi:hypothetical protein